jgi:steroid 5-alpha reductase family enzyme
MIMSKAPREAVIEFIDKKLVKEYDKFASGIKSNYYNWESYRSEFLDMTSKLTSINGELTIMTKYLKDKQLFREYQQYKDYYLRGDKDE